MAIKRAVPLYVQERHRLVSYAAGRRLARELPLVARVCRVFRHMELRLLEPQEAEAWRTMSASEWWRHFGDGVQAERQLIDA